MRTIRVPAAFRELFGRRTTLLEMGVTLAFSAVLSFLLLAATYGEWRAFAIWQAVVVIVLTVDISGGVVANLTDSTNAHYRSNARARLVFIAIHVQPLLLAWIFAPDGPVCCLAWAYTVLSALLVNALAAHPAQRPIAGALAAAGICLLLLLSGDTAKIVLALLSLYMFKVIYSFAVDHGAVRRET